MNRVAKILSVILVLTLICPLCPAVSLAATDNASVTYNNIPTTMVAGSKYAVTVTVKNTGSTVWTAVLGYRLRTVAATPFSGTSGFLGSRETVKKGAYKSFHFTMTAPATPGKYTVSWQMTDGTTSFGSTLTKTINVVPLALSSIYVLRLPKKVTYYNYEKLDLAGLAVMGKYNNGTKKQIPITMANVAGFDSSRTGSHRVTVNVDGKKASFSVTIYRMKLISIKVYALPTKRTYAVGEALDLTGLRVTGTFSNGKVKNLSGESFTVSGFDNTKVATGKKVTLTASGKSLSFLVDIIPNALMNAKVAAKAALAVTLSTYTQADYSSAGWTALNKAKTDGDAAIDAATTLALVDKARTDAAKAMDAVLTKAEEVIALANAKTAAHTALNTALATYTQANYSTTGWTALNKAKTDGDAAIDAATTIAAVTAAKTKAITDMAAVMTADVEALYNAKVAAKAALNTALAGYLEANYTTANWTALNKAKTDGDTAINAATTVTAVNTAKTTALNAMAAVKTTAQTALEPLKTAAKAALTAVLAAYTQSDYSTDGWTALNKAKTDGDKAIDAATSAAAIDNAKATAIAAMAAVLTRVQEQQAVADAKVNAKAALLSALNGYSSSDYSSTNWTALNSAKTAGDTAIEAAATITAVNSAKTAALSAMAAIKTLAEEAQELADYKTAAKQAVNNAYADYSSSNYSAGNWTALTQAKTDGLAAIDSAATYTAVDSAKVAALSAMDAVKTKAEQLADAKAAAHSALNSVLGTYSSTDYTEANWTALNKAKTDGDTAIDAATDTAGVQAAANAAIADMATVPKI